MPDFRGYPLSKSHLVPCCEVYPSTWTECRTVGLALEEGGAALCTSADKLITALGGMSSEFGESRGRHETKKLFQNCEK